MDESRRRTLVAVAVLAAAAAGLALFVALRGCGREPDDAPPPLLVVEREGLRWTYHLPTGTEALFDLASDPQCLDNLARDRPADARRLREEAERREGSDVEALRGRYRAEIERLRSLGYL